MEISNRLTKEIMSLNKKNDKGRSAVIKKREFFHGNDAAKHLPMNSPLIHHTSINKLQDMTKSVTEKNKTSTPSMPSRSGQLDFVKEGSLQMNRIIRDDGLTKPKPGPTSRMDEWTKPFQMRTLDNRDRDPLSIRKPPLPKDKKDESFQKEKSEQKSEGKINTTTESTPDTNQDLNRKEEIKRMKQTEELKKDTKIEVKIEEKSLDKNADKPPEMPKLKLEKRQLGVPLNKPVEDKAKQPIEEFKKAQNLTSTFDTLTIPEDTRHAMLNRGNASFTPGINKRRLRRDTNNTIDSFNKPTVPVNALPEISLTKPKPSADGKRNSITEKTDGVKENPLMKFCNPADRPAKDKVISPLGDLFLEGRSKSEPQEIKKRQSMSAKDIPIIDPTEEEKNLKSKKSEEVKPKIAKPLPIMKESASTDKKSGKETTMNKRKTYGHLRKGKILSVIQEEHKVLGEYVPNEDIPTCPYFQNCIVDQNINMIFFQNNKQKHGYINKMIKYFTKILDSVTQHKTSSKRRINWKVLDKARNIYLLIHELKHGKPLNYLEKQFQSMIVNMSRDNIMKILNYNIDFFKEQLELVNVQIKNDKIIEDGIEAGHTSNKDEYSSPKDTSEVSESEYSYSMDSMPSSKSVSSDKNLNLRDSMALPVVSNLGDSSSTLTSMARRYSKEFDSRRKTKSKFSAFADMMSSKKMVGDNLDMFSNKHSNRLDSEIGIYGFLKGGNTLPLVSDLVSGGDRNNNKNEVYERLKFFCKECFRSKETNNFVFLRILKEIDLYLKSYEEVSEDSDWDSDEEIAAVQLAKDLKAAIEEKSNLSNELSEVEKGLMAVNSNNSRDMTDSGCNTSQDNKLNASPILQKDTSIITDESSKLKDDNNLGLNDVKENLYKNVLKRGTDSPNKFKANENKSSSLVIENFSDSIDDKHDDDNSPSTPKITQNITDFRSHRRVNTKVTFNKRSSSIQSTRSNKSTATSKKVKKKSKTGSSKLKIIKTEDNKKRDQSESSQDGSNINSPKSAAVLMSGNSSPSYNFTDYDTKMSKGLSSFAKISTNKKKKPKIRKVKNFGPKAKLSKRKFKSKIEETKDIYSGQDMQYKFPVLKKTSQKNTSSKEIDRGSLNEINPRTKSLAIPLKNIGREEGREDLPSHTMYKKDSESNTAKAKRASYQHQKRNSDFSQVKSFSNVFNAFVGDEVKARAKTRRSSILLTARNESTKQLNPLLGTQKVYRNTRKLSKNKVHLFNIYTK